MSQELLDEILQELANGEYAEEVKTARDHYFEQLKDLREDDPSFERLTLCFLNYYVLDRPMDSGRGTPLQVFANREGQDKTKRQRCAQMAANVHSLFEVQKLDENGAVLRDLFTLEALIVQERRQLTGLKKGDLLEARLFPTTDRLVFANGAFVLHPNAAKLTIRKAVEACRMRGQPKPSRPFAAFAGLDLSLYRSLPGTCTHRKGFFRVGKRDPVSDLRISRYHVALLTTSRKTKSTLWQVVIKDG